MNPGENASSLPSFASKYWRAPRAKAPLDAQLHLPGSKSQTARELVLSALADGPSELRGVLHSRDSDLLVAALQSFGVQIHPWRSASWMSQGASTTVRVMPPARLLSSLPMTFIDCGLAGTVMRFVPAVAALARGNFRFQGDPQAAFRPLAPLLGALQDLGVSIEFDSGIGTSTSGYLPSNRARASLPFTVRSTGFVRGGTVDIDASASSQFVSALLLVAARFESGLEISLKGKVPSAAHIQMTIDALAGRGVVVHALTMGGHLAGTEFRSDTGGSCPEVSWRRFRVNPGRIRGQVVDIEPDLSNAGPFLAAALIAGGRIGVVNWPKRSSQAGMAWQWLLERMGARIETQGDTLFCSSDGYIKPLDVDMSEIGELVPTVAALAAFAQGQSVLRNVGHLRGHETDRLFALESVLNAAGARAKVIGDDLHIGPISQEQQDRDGESQSGQRTLIELKSFADHRMATFAALLGLRLPVVLDDIAATTKTLPTFVDLWDEMLGGNKG